MMATHRQQTPRLVICRAAGYLVKLKTDLLANDIVVSRLYRGRFALADRPLHFGSLVAALGSCLDARSRDGEWLVRMEDIDRPRNVPGAADGILATLEAFGFAWDGPVLWQTSRLEAYRAIVDDLKAGGLVYGCACSGGNRRFGKPSGGGRRPDLSRNLPPGLPPGRVPRAWRLRVTTGRWPSSTGSRAGWPSAWSATSGISSCCGPTAVRLPVGRGGGRCLAGHHPGRARRRSDRFDAAANLAATVSRLRHAGVCHLPVATNRAGRSFPSRPWRRPWERSPSLLTWCGPCVFSGSARRPTWSGRRWPKSGPGPWPIGIWPPCRGDGPCLFPLRRWLDAVGLPVPGPKPDSLIKARTAP